MIDAAPILDAAVGSGTMSPPNFHISGAGNLLIYTDFSDNHPLMGTWSFGYDSLNRLATATVGSNAPLPYTGNYGCWGYDAFGNRTMQAVSTTPCASDPPLMSWASYNSNNQFTATNQAPSGVPYDEAGNVLNDGVNQYLYDAEGRICAVASTPVAGLTAMTGYIYDAEGTRVAKGAITTWSCDPAISGFTTTNDYIIGPSGEQMTEMGMGGVTANGTTAGLTWQHTNAWAGGKLLATYDNDGLHFYLDDPLGSRRVQTDYEGVVERTCASLPFGDVETCAPTPTEHLFTGKERETESGNDYFGARYYASSMGRMMSPDWSKNPDAVPYADLANPQSLNLYSYGSNNPLSHKDDDGHCDVDGEHHGGVWCFFHALGLNETQKQQIADARFYAGEYAKQHKGFDPSKLSDEQVLNAYRNGGFANDASPDPFQLLGAMSAPIGTVPSPMEDHHLLPRQYEDYFSSKGLDIEDYTTEMSKADHRLKPDGVHAQGSEGWNQKRGEWIRNNPGASKEQVLQQLAKMKTDFGIK